MNTFYDGPAISGHTWKPVSFEDNGYSIEITYRNELGEEYVDLSNCCGKGFFCWEGCSGEWPVCMWTCPVCNRHTSTSMIEDYARSERDIEYDPFLFLEHHECFIDDNNLYVEQFETLDGIQWEIAVDVGEHLLDMLDDETKDEV